MATKISSSQLRSKLRQFQQQQQRKINNYNAAVRKYNAAVKSYNQSVNRAINDYNAAVRKHNATVKRNRQVIQRELNKLNSSSYYQNHIQFRSTFTIMESRYQDISARYDDEVGLTDDQETILDLIDKEYASSLATANYVVDDKPPEYESGDLEITDKLHLVSEDLSNRWKGAVYALSPNNPDAARHFCTSARELFTEFIEAKAPDQAVFTYNPNADKTERGNATRKEKIRYMMRGFALDSVVIDFADADIENILELFHVLSNATHGPAGKYEYGKLLQVKKRVEQGINFLCAISA